MNCEQLREHYELFALDIAEDPERAEIRAHLDRNCEICVTGVKQASQIVAMIAGSAPPAQPSAGLRRRILASIGSVERRPPWMAFWAMAGAALAAMIAVAILIAQSRQAYVQEALSSRDALAILYGPRTIEASFGGAQPAPPRGRVFVSPSSGVLLIASNLLPTPADKIYEMWLIPKGANPIPAGLFQSHRDGQAIHVLPGAVDIASTAAVAVTIENAGGAGQPTTTPLIVAPLPAL